MGASARNLAEPPASAERTAFCARTALVRCISAWHAGQGARSSGAAAARHPVMRRDRALALHTTPCTGKVHRALPPASLACPLGCRQGGRNKVRERWYRPLMDRQKALHAPAVGRLSVQFVDHQASAPRPDARFARRSDPVCLRACESSPPECLWTIVEDRGAAAPRCAVRYLEARH